jgi:hypothetical protein
MVLVNLRTDGTTVFGPGTPLAPVSFLESSDFLVTSQFQLLISIWSRYSASFASPRNGFSFEAPGARKRPDQGL